MLNGELVDIPGTNCPTESILSSVDWSYQPFRDIKALGFGDSSMYLRTAKRSVPLNHDDSDGWYVRKGCQDAHVAPANTSFKIIPGEPSESEYSLFGTCVNSINS